MTAGGIGVESILIDRASIERRNRADRRSADQERLYLGEERRGQAVDRRAGATARRHWIPALPGDWSARKTITRHQLAFIVVCVVTLGALVAARPLAVSIGLVALITFVYGAAVAYRVVAFWSAARHPEVVVVSDEDARAVPPDQLPVYTILVPAYREPEVMGSLVEHLSALEYPVEKLDIRLLLEEDDPETIAAAIAADLGPHFQIVRVPASAPRTKPKACNVGLRGARGEFVTIFDAEDRPDPLQLRRAVVAFSRVEPEVACFQAKLGYHNADQNTLTRWFAVEYAMWFSNLLPGLVARRAPLPLGGTSNHFRRDVLVEIGAWDPYNVTEDADLGIRLFRFRHRTRVLESTTMEEANSDVINWVKQRSRWYKGYLQTWLVHMRHPLELRRALGWRGFAGFTLFVAGTPALAILNPAVWTLTAVWFLVHPAVMESLFPAWIYYPSLAIMVIGNAALYYSWILSARMAGGPRLTMTAVLVPLYWVLMSVAAIKAAVQLVSAPSFWEKTVHGLDSAVASPAARRAAADVASGEVTA